MEHEGQGQVQMESAESGEPYVLVCAGQYGAEGEMQPQPGWQVLAAIRKIFALMLTVIRSHWSYYTIINVLVRLVSHKVEE